MDSSDILDTKTENTEAAGSSEGPDHTNHEHTDHDHDHEHAEGHEHQHGPVLNPECTDELVIDVPADEVGAAYRRVTATYRKFAKIPGFRAGKVPESVVRRRFAGEIRKEVIDSLLPDRFNKAISERGIQPVGQPQVTELSVDDGAPLHVKAVFEHVPDFSIEGYRDVTVEKPPVNVTEEEFQSELAQIRESRATMEPVEEDRALEDGDWAQIGYKGQVAGASEGGAAGDAGAGDTVIEGEEALLEIGGKSTVAAFTTALRGSKPGQELKAEVVYPADYGEPKLAGKTIAYELIVKGIKKRNVAEMTDEFAKEVAGYESVAALEEGVRKHLATRKQRAVEHEAKDKLMAAMGEKFSFPIPETLVQEQIDARLERGLRALAAQGMDPAQMRKLDFGRLRTAQRDSAQAEVKTGILLDRIAKEENITVSDEEVDSELQLVALQTREPFDTLKVRLTQDGAMARIKEQLRREKTATALYERLPG